MSDSNKHKEIVEQLEHLKAELQEQHKKSAFAETMNDTAWQIACMRDSLMSNGFTREEAMELIFRTATNFNGGRK